MRGALLDIPIESGYEGALIKHGIEGLFGAPVYENDSLMSGRPRFRGRPDLARSCMDHVARSGATTFFRSSRWRSELDRVVAQWSARHGARGAIEEPCSIEEAMVDDLRGARTLIEDRLGAHPVRHLCLPYTVGLQAAVQAARQAGYSTCFWGVLPDRRTNRPGQDPYYCPRLKVDYILRLPGHGRRSLGAALSHGLDHSSPARAPVRHQPRPARRGWQLRDTSPRRSP